ncbi:TPA: hypothetical protein U1V35_001623 [Streptococcus suis]|nr:hypothetical protein [Streptococcus suis]HEM3974023.1 hypothetical protein [Streptococcus suis]HEM3978298.1 hypothetical protein [Streptococcus suis]HEO8617620.1 hypothetical protein [Streptococcus suis]
MTLTLFFLRKFGLTKYLAQSYSESGLELLDFFVKYEKFNKNLTIGKYNKICRLIYQNFVEIMSKDITDEIFLLESVGANIESNKLHYNTNSIVKFSEFIIHKYSDEIESTVKLQKAKKFLDLYKQQLLKDDVREELNRWNLFCHFISNNSIRFNDELITENEKAVNQLIELGLVFKFEEKIILNINYLNFSDKFKKHFGISLDNYSVELQSIVKAQNRIEVNQDEIQKIKVSTNAEKAPLVPISLERFLVTDFKDKEIFILKLNGLTLQEIGDRYNLTRERVRQRIKKVLSKLPLISEVEEYEDVFCKYEITKDLFERVFNADVRVYELLNLVCKKGKLDFDEYIINNDYDSEIKDFVLRKKRKILISDKVRRATKVNALEEVLKDNINTQAFFTPEEIWYLYNEYVRDYQNLRISNLRSLLALADRSLHIIKSLNKGYRYFHYENTIEISDKLIDLFKDLELGPYNMDFIYSSNYEFLSSIGFNDGSELHNFLLKSGIKIPFVNLGRNPEFVYGPKSKKEYLLNEIMLNSGKSFDKFVNELNNRFGLQKNSIASYLWTEFPEYLQNGMIIFDKEDYSLLKEKLGIYLTEGIYIKDDFIKILKDKLDFKDITPKLIFDLGFLDRGALIISNKYKSAKDALKNKILENKLFTPDENPIYKTNDYYSTLYSLEKEFRVLKVGESCYLNTDILYNRDFSFEVLSSFIGKVEQFVNDGTYFTIRQLLDSGFRHNILDYGFELITMDRLIGFSDKVTSVNMSFPTLYFKGEKRTMTDFLVDQLLEVGKIGIEDFTDDLNQKYSLNLDEDNVKYRLLEHGVFYSQELGKLYIYKDDYLDEVYGK